MQLLDFVNGIHITDKNITEPQKMSAIREALRRFSDTCPLTKVKDIQGDAGFDYDLPDDFQPLTSHIISIELPIDNRPASILERNEFGVYQTDTAYVLRFSSRKPTLKFRLKYTLTHGADGTTIPTEDFYSVVNLATAYVCGALANFYITTSSPSIRADVVDYRKKSDEYRSQAKFYLELFKNAIDAKGVPSRIGEWDIYRLWEPSGVPLE